jgi:hypothetical protein
MRTQRHGVINKELNMTVSSNFSNADTLLAYLESNANAQDADSAAIVAQASPPVSNEKGQHVGLLFGGFFGNAKDGSKIGDRIGQYLPGQPNADASSDEIAATLTTLYAEQGTEFRPEEFYSVAYAFAELGGENFRAGVLQSAQQNGVDPQNFQRLLPEQLDYGRAALD